MMMQAYYRAVWSMVIVLVVCPAAGAVTEIALRERVELSGSVVRLGDVAEVVGADRQQARQLAALPLMPAPAPGTQRFLRKREVEDLLAAHGVSLRELRLGGVEQVVIAAAGDASKEREDASGGSVGTPENRHAAVLAGRVSQPLNQSSAPKLDAARAEELRDEFRRLIEDHLSAKTGQAAIWQVSCDVADQHLALLDAATTPPVCQGGNMPWIGRQRFVVSFHTLQGAIQVPVYAEVAATSAPLVVAIRPIARGDVITAAHVERRTVDYVPRASDRRSPVDAVEKLIGMEARQAIPAGQVVFTDQVQPPLLVKRGELITIVSAGGGIRVRTTGRARQDGARGELVQIESLETRERYDARVVGPREAAVFALSRPPALEPAERIEIANQKSLTQRREDAKARSDMAPNRF